MSTVLASVSNTLSFPPGFNIANLMIDRHVDEGRSDKIALLTRDESVTYRELRDNTNRYANALRDLNLEAGDRILMLINDSPEFYYLFFGAIKAGIIPVPMNTMLRAADYSYIIADSGAKALFHSDQLALSVPDGKEERGQLSHVFRVRGTPDSFHERAMKASEDFRVHAASEHDRCFFLYSSGTTGKPKGVVHVHRDIAAIGEFYGVQVLGAKETDVFYSIPRLFFAMGLGCSIAFPLYVGATIVLDTRRPTPEIALEIISRYKVTVFTAVPTFLASLLNLGTIRPEQLSTVRRCISGGEALPGELQRRWRSVASVPITDGIGSTEALHIYLSNRIDDIRDNSSGKPVPGYSVRILDEQGTELGDMEQGRLWVRGPSLTSEYWNNSEKTKTAIVDGWFDTGDTFYRDADGYYYYCGRNDDMLKVGGIWVSPFEVESALMSHPDVLEAAVVGRKDDNGLTKPEAWIVLRDGGIGSKEKIEELKTYCKTSMASYKYPRWIHLVETLPKTATGKIQRFKLRHTTE